MASATAVGIWHLLIASCRKVYIGAHEHARLDYVPGPDDPTRYVMCVWHDCLLLPTFAAPRRLREMTCCLVSQHQDGSYLANAMALLGYSTVRGSSRRGGARALRQLIADTAGKHIVITPDGPGGPRREMKPGAVYVAAQLGRQILPSAYGASRGWYWKGSWTDMLIPKPFSTIYLVMGSPIDVPADPTREQLHEIVQQVQGAMDELHAQLEGTAPKRAAPLRRAA